MLYILLYIPLDLVLYVGFICFIALIKSEVLRVLQILQSFKNVFSARLKYLSLRVPRDLEWALVKKSVVYVLPCLQANVPKTCQLLVFTYQCANEHASVPYGVLKSQLRVSTCQPTCQFFNLACKRVKSHAKFLIVLLAKC